MSASTSVVFTDLSFHWPDGTPVLDRLNGAFSNGRTGIIGANGSGKTTLLRLITGELQPTDGAVATSGVVDHLPQDVSRRTGTVAHLLGIEEVRLALHAIERGSTDPAHFDIVGDDWDIEERAVAELAALGLPTGLDRDVASLSGGESMLTAIAGIRLRRADIAVLDEPTNNLDIDARQRLYDVIRHWRGTLLVVSHDPELLDLMDSTAEFRDSELTVFGGPYSAYQEWVAEQQATALQILRTAEQRLKAERTERVKTEVRIAHSERQARKDRANRRFVPAVFNERKNNAEKAQGAKRNAADAKVEAARAAVASAELAVRDDDAIRWDLPDPKLPKGRRVAELRGRNGRGLVIEGPERVALIGPNGSGKTTLVEALLPQVSVPFGYLPQRIVLDDQATVLELMRVSAPHVPPAELRNRLARLLIRGAMVEQTVGSLSGGERFRVALARQLLTDPPVQLLVLDEPTNDLDLTSVDQLVAALMSYRGALLVVSHDLRFLGRLGLDHVLRLEASGDLVADVLPRFAGDGPARLT